jgi:hypothetical protein
VKVKRWIGIIAATTKKLFSTGKKSYPKATSIRSTGVRIAALNM